MIDNYSKLAKEYQESVNAKSYNAYYERPIMLELIGDVAMLDILELGCSAGWYSREFASNGAKVIAIDGNQKMIDFAKGNGSDVEFICHNLNDKLILDKQFDLIVASLVVHYIDDLYVLYSELFDYLKPGGRIILSTHNPVVEYQRLTDNYLDIVKVSDTWNFSGKKYPVSYYTRSIQENLMPLIKAGFTLTKVLEPKPLKILEEKDNEVYQKLTKKAGFLFIEARK